MKKNIHYYYIDREQQKIRTYGSPRAKRRRKQKRQRTQTAIACLLLLVLLFGIHAAAQHDKKSNQVANSDISMEDQTLPVGSIQSSDTDTFQEPSAAVTTRKLNLRSGPSTKYAIACTVQDSTKLTLTGNANTDGTWVQVEAPGGKTGWCCRPYLKMDTANTSDSQETAQASGPLHIKVSLEDQKVTVLDSRDRIIETFICSSGEIDSKTPTGTFTVSGRGESFYNTKLEEGGYYWTSFNGNYMFHSIPFDENYQIKQSEAAKLGTPASHGCIRLSVDNAKWIYDHIKDGSKVIIQ